MEISIQDLAEHAGALTRAKKAEEYRKKFGEKTIILFEIGDFYETYEAGAVQMAHALGVTLRHCGNIKEAAFPSKAKDTYFPKLIRSGYKICIMGKGIY